MAECHRAGQGGLGGVDGVAGCRNAGQREFGRVLGLQGGRPERGRRQQAVAPHEGGRIGSQPDTTVDSGPSDVEQRIGASSIVATNGEFADRDGPPTGERQVDSARRDPSSARDGVAPNKP